MDITATKQMIAVIEGRKIGNRQSILLGQLTSLEYDGLMDDPAALSIYPLEPLKIEFAKIDRCRTDSQRKLIGVLNDTDQVGIASLGEDWQITELDEFESYNKLQMEISSEGAQIIDYTFETGRFLNQNMYDENSIVAAVIYKSEGTYHLSQGIKYASQASYQTLDLTELPAGSAESGERRLPLAVALCSTASDPAASDSTLSHQVWVLGLSEATGTSSQPADSGSFQTETLCKLTLQGWNCKKSVDQDEWALESLDIAATEFEFKISCSLDSIP